MVASASPVLALAPPAEGPTLPLMEQVSCFSPAASGEAVRVNCEVPLMEPGVVAPLPPRLTSELKEPVRVTPWGHTGLCHVRVAVLAASPVGFSGRPLE